jgi:hypothetical protein
MKIFYGNDEHKIDVTEICYTKLLHDNIIIIPHHDVKRASIFSDPIHGVVKKIFIQDTEYDHRTKIKINIINDAIMYVSDIEFRLNSAVVHIINTSRYPTDTALHTKIKSIQEKIQSLPDKTPSTKILNIMACHVDTGNKYESILNNIRYLHGDLIIVNSTGLPYNASFRDDVASRCKQYMEIENNYELDIGKMMYALHEFDYSGYDFIVLMNDSFYLMDTIDPWYNCMIEEDKDLYGYLSNVELAYHYQSFLYGVKKTCIQTLIDFFNGCKEKFKQDDNLHTNVIHNYELLFANEFPNKACYIDIVDFPSQFHNNLLYYCPILYGKLLDTKIVTLVKRHLLLFFQ